MTVDKLQELTTSLKERGYGNLQVIINHPTDLIDHSYETTVKDWKLKQWKPTKFHKSNDKVILLLP